MSIDLFGPSVGAGGVTVRPTETRSFTAADTFFRDCSSPDLDDGTEFSAAWFNEMMAAARAVARGNGQTAGAVDIVAQDNADDSILLKAIQHLIQRGQPIYGEDTSSTVNVITAALSPALAEYKKGLTVAIKIANTNTGKTRINLNGLGQVNVKRPDGTDPLDSDLPAGAVPDLRFDGVNFQILGCDARPVLKRNTTIYVNGAIGNDANDGTANTVGYALATIQAAINLAWSYAPSQYVITIQIANGTYAAGCQTPLRAGPAIVIQGQSTTGVVVNGGASNTFFVQGPNQVTINNVTAANTAAPGGAGLFGAASGATLVTQNTASNACGGPVFAATNSSTLNCGSHTFNANCYAFWTASTLGAINLSQSAVFTITAAITVGFATAVAYGSGILSAAAASAATFVNAVNVTGMKFSATFNGVINSAGLGISYFPGTSAGSFSNGGQYD